VSIVYRQDVVTYSPLVSIITLRLVHLYFNQICWIVFHFLSRFFSFCL